MCVFSKAWCFISSIFPWVTESITGHVVIFPRQRRKRRVVSDGSGGSGRAARREVRFGPSAQRRRCRRKRRRFGCWHARRSREGAAESLAYPNVERAVKRLLLDWNALKTVGVLFKDASLGLLSLWVCFVCKS